METEKFIDLLSLDVIDDTNIYGLYPFPLCAVKENGHLIMASLALGGDILQCYKAFKKHKEGSTKVMMAVDFAPIADVEKDIINLLVYENGELSSRIIPYDRTTGVREEEVIGSKAGEHLFAQAKHFING